MPNPAVQRAAESIEAVAFMLRLANNASILEIAGPGLASILEDVARNLLDVQVALKAD